RDHMERIGRMPIDPGCHVLDCFRIVVPWIVVRLPGQPVVRWRVYAVLVDTAAALAVGWFCVSIGLSEGVANHAVAVSAFGAGTLAPIVHPYTADPVMFLLTPVLFTLLVRGRLGAASTMSAAGVFAKEFAAVPLWIFGLSSWRVDRRRAVAAFGVAAAVTL